MSAPLRARRRTPIWPIWVLAMPAAVSIWAGWVGLGQLTGFGVVQLLPGIWDELTINTAITLPIGMEAYAGYALYVWLATDAPTRAKDFARVSALGALLLGALGQMAYHLMAAASVESAPWQITAAVSCLPVGVLGMAAALAHLVRSEEDAREEVERVASAPPAPVAPAPEGSPISAPFRTVTPPPPPSGSAPLRAVPSWSAMAAAHRPDTQPAGRPAAPPQPDPAEHPDPMSVGRATAAAPGRPTHRPTGSTQTPSPERPAAPLDRRAQVAPAGRPATAARNGSGRRRTRSRKPRTDAELVAAIRQLTARNNGSPPSQYQLRQQFGVGTSRATRLLADLHATSPAAGDHGAVTSTGDRTAPDQAAQDQEGRDLR